MLNNFEFKSLRVAKEDYSSESANDGQALKNLRETNEEDRKQDLHAIKIDVINKIISYFKVAIITLGVLAMFSMVQSLTMKYQSFELVITRIPDAVLITIFTTFFAHIVGLVIIILYKLFK